MSASARRAVAGKFGMATYTVVLAEGVLSQLDIP